MNRSAFEDMGGQVNDGQGRKNAERPTPMDREQASNAQCRRLAERAFAPARRAPTMERCARRERFDTVWSGWGSNSRRKSFRFCRAKLVIGWPFCSARSPQCLIVGAGALR